MSLTGRQRAHIRWWRDRARALVLTGLGVYACGFFLGWIFALPATALIEALGVAIGLTGAACGLLWLVDAQGSPSGDSARD